MLLSGAVVDDGTTDVEWWQRWQARWLRWLAADRRRPRVLLALTTASVLLILIGSGVESGFGRGARVWWWCTLILVWWLLVTPTKTVRWSSVLRMFTVSMPWAVVIAWTSIRLANAGDLAVGAAGPSIGIAAVFEESMKLVPLAVLGVLAPGRVRRFGAIDWLLLGLATGMGFQVAEDFVRQATFEPSPLAELLGDQQREYGLTLFGGAFDYGGASYQGHHIETALVAGTFGIAVQLSARRGNRWWWLLPLVPLVVTIVDHAGFNATVADPVGFPDGRSTVPAAIHRLWEWTGQGHGRTGALVAVAVIGLLLDGSVLTRRTLAPPRPLPEPGTVLSTATSASSAAPRPLKAATSAAASVVTTARQTLRTIAAGYPAALRCPSRDGWSARGRPPTGRARGASWRWPAPPIHRRDRRPGSGR